jgi:hypothetical protein
MDLRQVDQTVVTTTPAVAGPPRSDPWWAPEPQPTAVSLTAPVASPATVAWYPNTAASVPAPVPQSAPWQAPALPLVTPVAQQTVQTYRRRTTRTSLENNELTRRIVVLVFGLIELFIGMRVVLLLLDARTTNGLVAGIMNLSGPFVAPFEGILRTNSVSTAGSILDVAALLALAGWAVVEMVVFWVLATFRREPA